MQTMKKMITIACVILATIATSQANAADLLQVYRNALQYDSKFKQALANRQVSYEQVPQSLSQLLPQISLQGTASYQKSLIHGNNVAVGGASLNGRLDQNNRQKGLGFTLNVTQNIFNFTDFMNVSSSKYTVKAAYATYTAAIQDLIQRTSQAYFDVLEARDTLRYTGAEKRAFYRQYVQAEESYKVGVKTLTDVYNAKAAYDSAIAAYVGAENNLQDQRENLMAITGHYYNSLATLDILPLVKPVPANINAWGYKAQRFNWELQAAHFTSLAAHDAILSAEGGHIPTVGFTGSYANNFSDNVGRPGNTRTKNLSGELELDVPVYSGGEVSSQVREAIAKYSLASAQMEQTYRDVENQTRQAYLGAISGISKVQADRQAVISQRSSLEGTEEGYKVGTNTMIDVLNVEKQLYNAEREHAKDRYAFVMSLITLKQQAGTLTVNDIARINSWLSKTPTSIKPDQELKSESKLKMELERKNIKISRQNVSHNKKTLKPSRTLAHAKKKSTKVVRAKVSTKKKIAKVSHPAKHAAKKVTKHIARTKAKTKKA
jgi:outer membrane protein